MHEPGGRIFRRWILPLCLVSAACGAQDAPRDGGLSQLDDGGADSAEYGGTRGRDAGSANDAGGRRDAGPSAPAATSDCAPLPPATGTTITVTPAQADALASVVSNAAAGTTILLEDGVYRPTVSGEQNRRLIFRKPGVTQRSASGDPNAVVLDGDYQTNEILYIVASNVTIAELTVTRAVDHLAHVMSEGPEPVTGAHFFRVRFVDAGEQFLKVNPGSQDGWTDDGVVACSHFEMTDAGRPHVERAVGGCYTGGIDAHASRGWQVHHNTFEGIYCAGEGLAEHAIHFWRSSRDTVVENNRIINCARGIGFGLDDSQARRTYPDAPYPGAGFISHFDGIIRNNVIWADIDYFDTGIELANARGARVYHNTVVSTAGESFFSSIDYRFASTQVEIKNNLTRRITMRNGASATLEANLEGVEPSIFVDVDARDFHLSARASEAIDRGVVVDGAGLDMDGETHDRGAAPDIGADER
jgi:hypothetical protein